MRERGRILITGSRSWTDAATIQHALVFRIPWKRVTIVSGACPTGADRLCEEAAEMLGYTIERHPARWEVYGKAAGFRRNEEMVKLGADRCLAFIRNNSSGASHTARLAKRAGIPTRIWQVTDADS